MVSNRFKWDYQNENKTSKILAYPSILRMIQRNAMQRDNYGVFWKLEHNYHSSFKMFCIFWIFCNIPVYFDIDVIDNSFGNLTIRDNFIVL